MRYLAVFTLTVAASLASAVAPFRSVPEQWLKLIEQLGDEDIDVRRAARKELSVLGEKVLPTLRRAAREHADPDVRLHAMVLATAIYKEVQGEAACLEGHTGWVFRVVVTPDGKHAVSSGDSLRVWDLKAGKEVRNFGPRSSSWGLSLSADGKRVLASQSDHTVRLFEVATGKEVHVFAKHKDHAWAAALSPDGSRAVTGGMDKAIHLWDAVAGKHLLTFGEAKGYPRCAAFSPDGKVVAIGASETTMWNYVENPATVSLWDVEKGKVLHSAEGHTSAITSVTWSKDGKRLATSSFDKTVRLWDAASLKHIKTLKVSRAGCDCVAFTPDGRQLVTAGCGDDLAVRVWDAETGAEVRSFEGHARHVLCVTVTPDGTHVLSASSDSTVRVWRRSRR